MFPGPDLVRSRSLLSVLALALDLSVGGDREGRRRGDKRDECGSCDNSFSRLKDRGERRLAGREGDRLYRGDRDRLSALDGRLLSSRLRFRSFSEASLYDLSLPSTDGVCLRL